MNGLKISRYVAATRRRLCRENFVHDYFIDWDYINRPLPSNALDILDSVAGTLSQFGVETIVAQGTLLGLVRDGQIIEHDTDLDLYVTDASMASVATQCLSSKGWTVGQHARIGTVSSHITLFNANQVLLDLTFFEKVGNKYFSFKEFDGYLVIDEHLLSPSKTLYGRTHLRIPNDPQGFLEYFYGADWQTPTNKKVHWKKEYCGAYVGGVFDIVRERNRIVQRISRK